MTPLIETWLSLALVLCVGTGLGSFVPIKSVAGRVMIGSAIIPLVLLLSNLLAGVAFSKVFWPLILLGGIGCVGFLWTIVQEKEWIAFLNPTFTLPLLFAITLSLVEKPGYQIFDWDEFASWMYWTKEAYLTDTLSGPAMHWRGLGYPQGWPLAVVFPQLAFENFNPQRSLVVGVVWQAAVLGLVYEISFAYLRRFTRLVDHASRAIGYAVVFSLMIGEALYTYVPQNFLIELPQIFVISSIFLLLMLAALGKESLRATAFAIGLLLSAGLMLKLPVLAVMPGLSIIILWSGLRQVGKNGAFLKFIPNVMDLSLFMVPPLLVLWIWVEYAAHSPSGFNSLSASFDFNETHFNLLTRLVDALWAYVSGWKAPLTLFAVLGLVFAFSDKLLRPIALGILLYSLIHLAGMFELYAFRFGSYEVAQLQSHQRYLRILLRLIHLIGGALFILNLTRLAIGAMSSAKFVKLSKAFLPISLLAAVLLGSGEVLHEYATLNEIRNRAKMDPERLGVIQNLKEDYFLLRKVLERENLIDQNKMPLLVLIAQEDDGYSQRVVQFLSLESKRTAKRRLYHVPARYSWGSEAVNLWMIKSTKAQAREELRRADIIWNHKSDKWILDVLQPLLASCKYSESWVFLVKSTDARTGYRCYSKW